MRQDDLNPAGQRTDAGCSHRTRVENRQGERQPKRKRKRKEKEKEKKKERK